MRRLVGLLSIVAICAGLGAAAGWFLDRHQVYVIRTGSMEPAYSAGDVVVDSRNSVLEPGDTITFRYSGTGYGVVTHRIAAIRDDGTVVTKGDANDTTDPWTVQPGDVLGEVVGHVPHAGYAVVYLQQWTGLASLVTTVLCVVLLWEMFFPSPPPTPTLTAQPVLLRGRRPAYETGR